MEKQVIALLTDYGEDDIFIAAAEEIRAKTGARIEIVVQDKTPPG